MCELCSGRHAIHVDIGFGFAISPCPNCGPVPADEQQVKLMAIMEDVAASNISKKSTKGA